MKNTYNKYEDTAELLKELRDIIESRKSEPLPSIAYDHKKGIVVISGKAISLTHKENSLFNLMAQNTSTVESLNFITSNFIKNTIWAEENVSDATVRVTLMRLRDKIESNPANPEVLLSIYGKGYVLLAQVVRIIGHDNYSI